MTPENKPAIEKKIVVETAGGIEVLIDQNSVEYQNRKDELCGKMSKRELADFAIVSAEIISHLNFRLEEALKIINKTGDLNVQEEKADDEKDHEGSPAGTEAQKA